MEDQITYRTESNLALAEFRELLIASTLGERRPVDDDERLARMVAHASLIVTARHGATLVGVARSLSDFSFATYLSDLAVRLDYQKRGIGKELIRRTKWAAPQAKLILLAAPAAIPYYPHIGMTHYEYCYYLNDADALR
ncbi:MAG: GNAT family N-acetyltransferase [Ferruginibacter sp.]|nr:GNAT family N-acetyltransferase [Cytophagales bacterium]